MDAGGVDAISIYRQDMARMDMLERVITTDTGCRKGFGTDLANLTIKLLQRK